MNGLRTREIPQKVMNKRDCGFHPERAFISIHTSNKSFHIPIHIQRTVYFSNHLIFVIASYQIEL